ncbi:MAG: T9SS type A sorting domain-containing protein [Crocinitomicaceae bacterium]
MNIKNFLLAGVIASCAQFSLAQIEHGGTPKSWMETSVSSVEFNSLPSVDIDALKAEDAITEQHKDIPLRFAYAHEVNFNLVNSGEWTTASDGSKIWRLGVESENAHSLNVTFDQFVLSEGATVFIYNEDKSDVLGSFTAENNKPSQHLGTSPVKGDKIIIELHESHGTLEKSQLSISHIAHDYKNVYSLSKAFGDSGGCNNNVACPISNGWEDQVSSVALITLANGTRWCTGSMVANTSLDDTPYFLTADHCEDGQNVTTWVFHFNYQSPTCSPNADGSLSQSVSGSTLRATNPGSDVCLLELDTPPPTSYNVFYSGWDKSGDVPQNTTGIHHPSGDVKKFSVDNDPPVSSGSYWRVVDWDDGTTEPGSSGSALFDQNKRIVGQLYGGFAACGNDEWDEYGKVSVSWEGSSSSVRLKDWLDPNSTGVETQDGYYPGSASIAQLDATMKFELYPNPSNNDLSIRTDAIISDVVIYTMNGSIVQREKTDHFSIENLQAGMYYVQIHSNEGTAQLKLIKN